MTASGGPSSRRPGAASILVRVIFKSVRGENRRSFRRRSHSFRAYASDAARKILCRFAAANSDKTPEMVSFTRASGSLTVQFEVRSHAFAPLVHEVMKSGPSMAWITSNAEIWRGSRDSAYPPFMPACDRRSPVLVSRCRILASNCAGIPYVSAMSLALWAGDSGCSAKYFRAISP